MLIIISCGLKSIGKRGNGLQVIHTIGISVEVCLGVKRSLGADGDNLIVFKGKCLELAYVR